MRGDGAKLEGVEHFLNIRQKAGRQMPGYDEWCTKGFTDSF